MLNAQCSMIIDSAPLNANALSYCIIARSFSCAGGGPSFLGAVEKKRRTDVSPHDVQENGRRNNGRFIIKTLHNVLASKKRKLSIRLEHDGQTPFQPWAPNYQLERRKDRRG